MNPKALVTHIDISRRLKELGVKQNSLFMHVEGREGEKSEWFVRTRQSETVDGPDINPGAIAAFTASEVAKMLPTKELLPTDTHLGKWYRQSIVEIGRIANEEGWRCAYVNPNTRQKYKGVTGLTLADCIANMLIYLITEGYIQP